MSSRRAPPARIVGCERFAARRRCERASATVRAVSDVEVLVLSRQEFEDVADHLPVVYRNLGAILSRRLNRTNSRWLHAYTGRTALLQDGGAPPLLGYALACSVAWHTRKPTLLQR